MEENEYRDAYQRLTEQRCIYEKAVNSRRCACEQSNRFFLADREGVTCNSKNGKQRCEALLELMRNKARFALQRTRIEGHLPHNKEIKVQIGGLLGLQRVIFPALKHEDDVKNIYGLLNKAIVQFGDLENIPYEDIIKFIVSYEGRPKHRRPHNN